MTGVIFGCIAPHGDMVIPEIAGRMASDERVRALTAAMQETGRRMEAVRTDTVIVLTPHGIRVNDAVCVMTTAWAEGTLSDEESKSSIQVKMACDVELARGIAERASQGYKLPVVTAVYGSASGESSITPLDWGAVVPLWFMGARWEQQPQLVCITPSRGVSLRQLYDLGIAIAEVAQESGKRLALIASADWGHAHQAGGPYGYDAASAQFDALAVEIIRSDDLDRFLEVDPEFGVRAKVDGLWQAITLAGAIHHTPLRGEFLAYEVPSYFGMIVATFS